ncbi:MAG: carboxylating nicotinate-nucleotide diphosphorylase [Bacteriovoracaceae bacterium]|jgi:nicotinate-nucleotide pyrophosphorylase (carboxylating)|nr:carboxylating nicotinate-nucleotide diphosphorylase [Bacteriovoracaceae bacterium]
MLSQLAIKDSLDFFIKEDEIYKNFAYINSLPKDMVKCSLKFKDDMVISGLPFFFETLNYFLDEKIDYLKYLEFEGKEVSKEDKFEIHFDLPFNIVLSAERLALNLLQKSSSISTNTKSYVDKLKNSNIKILDTRKTTPGLRFLEKYAVNVGGGDNHRFNQTDIWMIKDNHKSFFGGVKQAIDYFNSVKSFYTPIVLEIHSIDELKEGIELGAKHFMLDNFSPDQIKEASLLKQAHHTFEVSGGINLDNIESYIVEGVDVISSGSLTYNARQVDISLKYHR